MLPRLAKIAAVAALLSAAFSAHAVPVWMTGNDGSTLYTVDSANGASTAVGNFGQGATYTLSFDAAGTLYGISNGFSDGTLVTIDKTTGHATTVGVATGISDLMAMAFAPDGTLYAGSWSTNSLYVINKNTGAATLVGSLGFGGIMDLDFDSQGNLFALSDSLFKVDLATGNGSLVTNLANSCLMGMAIDQQDRFLATDYCTNNTPLYQINTANGSLISLGNTGIASAMGGAIEDDVANVPEPGSVALAGAAIAALLITRRRARKYN
jgi:tricorn protease-like protein